MSHLRLVPPPAGPAPGTAPVTAPAPARPWDDPKVARLFFQAASGLCLCRDCAMKRHPAYAAR
jgi:hypothetical protein